MPRLDRSEKPHYNREKEGGVFVSDMELLLHEMQKKSGELAGVNFKLDGMDECLDSIENKLDEPKEAHEVTPEGLSHPLDWAAACCYVVKFPLPKL